MSCKKEFKKSDNSVRVILNVPTEIDKKFRELSSKRGIPKSSMIIFAMSWYLDYQKSLEFMPEMLKLLNSSEILNLLSSSDTKPKDLS